MKKIIKLLCLMSLVLLTPLFSEVERLSIEDRVYGIVRGDNVLLYSRPDVKSKTVIKLKNNEFIAVSRNETEWLKIYTVTGKEGWIAKSKLEVIDKNNKAFMEILNNHFSCRIGRNLNGISKENIYVYSMRQEGEYYFISYLKEGISDKIVIHYTRMYKYIDGNLWEIVWNNMGNSRFHLYNNRIFIYDKLGVNVYDIESIKDSISKLDKKHFKKEIMRATNINLNITKYLDSYMEFDPKTKIVTQYLRIKENQPYVIEKYQFKNDEFVQIGGRQHEM